MPRLWQAKEKHPGGRSQNIYFCSRTALKCVKPSVIFLLRRGHRAPLLRPPVVAITLLTQPKSVSAGIFRQPFGFDMMFGNLSCGRRCATFLNKGNASQEGKVSVKERERMGLMTQNELWWRRGTANAAANGVAVHCGIEVHFSSGW